MNNFLQFVWAIIVFAVVYCFLIPLLPAPFGTVALVVLILSVIYWVLTAFSTFPRP